MTRCGTAFSMQTFTRGCIPTCCAFLEHMAALCQITVQKFFVMQMVKLWHKRELIGSAGGH